MEERRHVWMLRVFCVIIQYCVSFGLQDVIQDDQGGQVILKLGFEDVATKFRKFENRISNISDIQNVNGLGYHIIERVKSNQIKNKNSPKLVKLKKLLRANQKRQTHSSSAFVTLSSYLNNVILPPFIPHLTKKHNPVRNNRLSIVFTSTKYTKPLQQSYNLQMETSIAQQSDKNQLKTYNFKKPNEIILPDMITKPLHPHGDNIITKPANLPNLDNQQVPDSILKLFPDFDIYKLSTTSFHPAIVGRFNIVQNL